jgi:hypothetical protein
VNETPRNTIPDSWQNRNGNLFSSRDFCSNVRPEFLEEVIQDGGFHLRPKVLGGLARRALLSRIVGVEQASFQDSA